MARKRRRSEASSGAAGRAGIAQGRWCRLCRRLGEEEWTEEERMEVQA